MPFIGATNIDGDSKDLLGRYDKFVATLRRDKNPPAGLISHYCIETDTGIRVVNCFETEAQLRASYDAPEFRNALETAGIDYRNPQMMRVHNYFHISG